MTDVFAGIRILEVAEHTFVPVAAAVLADWGADVIKVEHPERGDAMRGLASSAGITVGGGGVHVLMEHANRGKRSVAIDLAQPEGLELLYRLAATSDVFLTNKLAGVRKKLKIDVDDIRAHNARIVYVRGSGYGERGPDADLGGYDSLGFWARAGNAMAAKSPDLEEIPGQPAPAYGDSLGGMTIAGGIAAALLYRERTGVAPIVDVSLLSTGLWAMSAGIALSQQTKEAWVQRPRQAEGPHNPLVGHYRTSDGRWLSLTMLQGFHYWPEMCRVLGRPDLAGDERFCSAERLFANGREASALVAESIASATMAEWQERLRGQKGQWTPVQDSMQVADDPMVEANGYLLETRTQDGIQFKLVTTPVQFDEQPAQPRRSPGFNEHGDDILTRELGLDTDALLELKVKGVVA